MSAMRASKLTLFAVSALLLLAGVVSAQNVYSCSETAPGAIQYTAPWYCSQINQAVAQVWGQWEPVAIIVVVVVFLIAAILMMLGMAMRNDKLKNFGIGELYEALATLIIVSFFMVITAILFGIIPSFITGPLNPYNTSLTYIASTVNVTHGTVASLYNVILLDSFYSSLSVTISTPGTGGIELIQPLAQVITAVFIIPARVISSLLVDGMLALTAEFYFILFFMYVGIPVLLIPGILFRSIFPLRSLGGMLIAAAFAFYIIMPTLFAVAYSLTNVSVTQQLQSATQAIVANGQGTQAQTNAVSASSPLVADVSSLQSDIGAYFISVLFFPALILAISYTSMTIIAEFIGGVAKTSKKMGLL